ncbi:MAG: hypothetical protein A4E42_00931 [Methanoregulaceae archaeon PtaU1.Bin222]|nr:MAG: hypothetical protein A4E42_00931 [Methanoregulaceae archaeon PtaU1.Bin222]
MIISYATSFVGRMFFARSTRMMRMLVRMPSNGIDLTETPGVLSRTCSPR